LKIPSIKKIQQKILNLPIISTVVNWSKNNSLPGFFNVPIFDVIQFIKVEIQQFNLSTRANSMAFSFFLSLFPSILVVFTLIPLILPLFSGMIISYIPEDLLVYQASSEIDFNATVLKQIELQIQEVQFLPQNAQSQIFTFIRDVAFDAHFDVLSLGFFLAFFFASNGMLTMMKGFEKVHQSAFIKRTVIQKRLVGFWITIVIGFLVVFSVILIILGKTILGYVFDYFETDNYIEFSIEILRWIITFLLFYSGIAMIYRFGISTKTKVKYFSPGATLATFLSIASSIVFAWYVNAFGSYNQLYGTIGTFIVIMLWIQINCYIILIGFELNAAIAVNRDLKKFIIKKEKKIRKG